MNRAPTSRKWIARRGLPVESDLEKAPHSLYEGIEYQQFWTGLQKRKLDELERDIVCDLLPPSGNRIVDVGCGYGRLADCYLDRFRQVVLVDGSVSLLRQALENTGGRATYIAADATHLPFRAASFDAALLVRVFHHIPDSQSCLSELHRVLCNQGRFVFSYCNKRNALRVAKWLVRRNTENPFCTDTVTEHSTVISHHPDTVHRMLLERDYASICYRGAGVLDQLAGRLGHVGQWIPPGRRVTRLMGWSKIAPWIFCGASARAKAALVAADDVADLLQCPRCGAHVIRTEQAYVCGECQNHYPIDGGISDFRLS